MSEFRRRGHATAGYGYRADKRHLLGVPPKNDAAKLLRAMPVPTVNGGLDEAAIKQLGLLDQGGAPYCVGNAWADAIRDCELRNGNPAPQLGSRLWLMYFMHALENDISGFDGAIVGDGAEVLERLGIPPESAFPYSDADPNPSMQRPSADVERLAYDQIAEGNYARIMSTGPARVDDVMRALAYGGNPGPDGKPRPCPVVFGSNVSNAFASNNLPSGFVVDVPDPSDIDGGHAEEMIRFAFDPGVEGGVKFRVKNSWGPNWGDGGFWWMTPKYLMDANTDDLWVCDYLGVTP